MTYARPSEYAYLVQYLLEVKLGDQEITAHGRAPIYFPHPINDMSDVRAIEAMLAVRIGIGEDDKLLVLGWTRFGS